MDAAGTDPALPMPSALLFPTPLAPYRYYSPPSTSSLASSALVSSRHHASLEITSLPLLVLTVLGILTISALLLTYYVLVIRCCLTWHTTSSPESGSRLIISLSRRRRRHSNTHELPVVHGPAPDEEHHGLAEMAIRALPAFRYSKAMKNDDNTGSDTSECAVCLGEFQEEERIKLLPSCLHVFHAECIDTWLQGNANCPLCRAAITSTTQVPAADLQLHRQRPAEVFIQVQVPLTDEEANRLEGDAAYEQAGKENTKTDAHGDGSGSGSSEVICRL